MQRAIVTLVLILGLAYFHLAEGQNRSHFVLPNPSLLGCRSSGCLQLWPDKPEPNTVFPKQMIIDMNQDCIYGITALYDKSVSIDGIRSAIDEHYKEWAVNDHVGPSLYAWRVGPEKFAIQLTVASKEDEKRNVAEAGAKQAIYVAFGGRSACNPPQK